MEDDYTEEELEEMAAASDDRKTIPFSKIPDPPGYEEGWNLAIAEAIRITEVRRQKVLDNPNDPSWTEHFAELQGELGNLKL